jgi:hypothetical protein
MQLDAGRSADQWRGFTALNPRDSERPLPRYDSAGGRAARRHQPGSDRCGRADTEFGELPRKREHEPRKPRRDGARQCDGCHGNTPCCTAFGVLMQTRSLPPFWRQIVSHPNCSSRSFVCYREGERWTVQKNRDRRKTSIADLSVSPVSVQYAATLTSSRLSR